MSDRPPRILLADDEQSIQTLLSYPLQKDGYEVVRASDGREALARFAEQTFDLVVLDVMMPRMDGLEVCRRLRGARPGMPILMLTARGSEDDKVRGLGEGADDYVTKPFSARELLARVRALGRRAPASTVETLDIDGASFDFARLTVARGTVVTPLTPREVGMVRLLHARDGKVVSRAELLEQVFGQRGDLQTRAVDMAIAVLRKKVERNIDAPTLIVSVKGAGYAWGGGAAP